MATKAQAVTQDDSKAPSKGRTATPAPELSKAQQAKVDGFTTVSDRIRYLNSEGFSRSAIAQALGKRYQHVRNVLITPVAKQAS